ncbi:hypothetical protein [Anaerotignum propionicum]|uniref:hypothetical protein n=1 Tax=Anaerotignum propionicum TaxID=28446 RepID=UPI00210D8E98|nr:hypothetical protein [Anaerotignum propionicum]MCQ4936361.1 hypothetical protein [Anaerotignum propionicum]
MRDQEFEGYLLQDDNIKSKVKAVRSRINKARMIERHFDTSLDTIVSDDGIMYETLVRIKAEMKDTNGNLSNSLRKYYIFSTGKAFPTLGNYKK